MTPRRPHPDDHAWERWLDQGLDAAEQDALQRHQETCASCAAVVQTLRLLREVSNGRAWDSPPDAVVDQASALPDVDAPTAPESPLQLEWAASDVRGSGASVAGDAQIVARSTPGAEISVLAIPPVDDLGWTIEGRVWLRQRDSGSIRVVLSHEDHVIRQEMVQDGERFRWQEPLGPGWTLEFHLPQGECVILGDPFAS